MFVNAIMYYKVKDATSAVANVDDYACSAKLLAATTLRNILGTKTLGDILSERMSPRVLVPRIFLRVVAAKSLAELL